MIVEDTYLMQPNMEMFVRLASLQIVSIGHVTGSS